MKPMDSLKKPAMMVRLRNSKGFSLIEMAIVLVIIGIIIAAIIKGQDLITNSQAKKVVSAVSSWRNLTVAFVDRNGRFPGDAVDKDGIIGNGGGADVAAATNAIGEIVTVMPTAPENPVVLGSSSFYVYIGNVNIGTVLAPLMRNAIMVCGDAACANFFNADQLEMIKTVDTSFDGIADAGLGQFRAVATAPTLLPAPPVAVVALNGRFSGTFSGAAALTVAPIDLTTAGTATPWDATAHRAAVWFFDKPF